MSFNQVRVVGSGFTSFSYKNTVLAWLERVDDTGQDPGTQPEAITPLGQKYPIEIVTPRYLGMGTLTLTVRELWNAPVWWQLAGLEGTNDIISVFERLAEEPSEVTCTMIIQPPGTTTYRGKTYHGCVVTNIDQRESIWIGALSVPRTLTVAYTHTTTLP
jgi:hypothetical protein